MKPSTEAQSPANDPAIGALSGDPAATISAQASGLAGWLQETHERSATGHRAASPMGQISWAVFEWARNPYVLLVTIYLFAPYFSRVVVGDPVRGQAIWGTIAAVGGLLVAALAPFLGAIADAGGKRKPWIGFYVVILTVSSLLMWFAMPHSSFWQLVFVGALVVLANTSFEFTQVFHNSLLPTIAPPRRIAALSGLGLALTNAAGVILLTIMLVCFALPESVHWSFIPDHPLFGISKAMHEPERLSGPASAIWLIIFSMPLFFFTPDRPKAHVKLWDSAVQGVRSVVGTVRSLRHYRNVGAYLLARLFFNDGMTAVLTFGGIYAASHLRLGPGADDPLWHRTQHLRGARRLPRRLARQPPRLQARDLRQHRRHPACRACEPDHGTGPHPLVHPLRHSCSPDLVAAVLQHLAGGDLPGHREFHRGPDHGGLRQQPHHAGAHRTDRKDDRVLRPLSLSGTSTTFLATGFVGWLTAVSHSQRIGLLGETLFLGVGLILMFFVREERATTA